VNGCTGSGVGLTTERNELLYVTPIRPSKKKKWEEGNKEGKERWLQSAHPPACPPVLCLTGGRMGWKRKEIVVIIGGASNHSPFLLFFLYPIYTADALPQPELPFRRSYLG
jgi:hypothetical protein